MNYGNPGTPATPSQFGAPPTPGILIIIVSELDSFFVEFWKLYFELHTGVVEISPKTFFRHFGLCFPGNKKIRN